MAYHFEPVRTDDAELARTSALLREVFPKARHFTDAVLRWQYRDDPDGPAVGTNAWEEGMLAAHYVTIPLLARVNGREERGLLSLNTATHPAHQGKGLFTRLANATYQAATDAGYGFVIGVANANSTHGFINKLGFQLVSPLRAMAGFGPIRNNDNGVVGYERVWHPKALEWRTNHPLNKYSFGPSACKDLVFTDRTQVGATLLLAALDLGTAPKTLPASRSASLFRIWVGLDSRTRWRFRPYINIPMRFRPSPLNLIFKDLSGAGRTLDPATVRFQAIDFDTL